MALNRRLLSLVGVLTIFLISLFLWSGVFMFYFTQEGIKYFESKLDFSVYFKASAQQSDIRSLQSILENFPNVDQVVYVTKAEALTNFKSEVSGNQVISKALTELNTNPLVDYLIVRAKDPTAYAKVASYLDQSPYRSLIEFVTYAENQQIINKFIGVSNNLRLFILVFLVLVMIFGSLIIFNSTLVAIFAQREEVEVLRLIGATNWFIRLPFLIFTFLISIFGYLISLFLVALITMKTSGFISIILPQANFSQFIFHYFWPLNFGLFGFILAINLFSTFVALQKHLNI